MKSLYKSDVFVGQEYGYNIYRIPTIIKTADNRLLAFCEGRQFISDTGYINILMKKSFDYGKTWSDFDIIIGDGKNTYGNPCCVVDAKNGRVHMVCNFNRAEDDEGMMLAGNAKRKMYYLYSDDNGDSWSAPRDITDMAYQDNWGWHAFGPCHGIQTKEGRIIFPCNHSRVGDEKRLYYSYSLYSDDGCQTFKKGEDNVPDTNEVTFAFTKDGNIYSNERAYYSNNKRRRSYSYDGGITWQDNAVDEALLDPKCNASVINIGENLAFSNIASTERNTLTIKLSKDDGLTWYEQFLVNEGPSAYSDLVVLDENILGCLYERGDESPYEKIAFMVIEI